MNMRHSVKLFMQNKLLNILAIVQMAVLLMLCVFMISSVLQRLELYLPFEDVLNQKGMYATLNSTYGESHILYDCSNKTALEEYDIKHVKEVFSRFEPRIVDLPENAICYAYNDNVISRYTPQIESGKWLDVSESSGNQTLEAVIYQSGNVYKIGDKISCTATTYDNEDVVVTLEICGILHENAKVFGRNEFSAYANHQMLFDSIENMAALSIQENNSSLIIFLNNTTLQNNNFVSFYSVCNSLFVFDEEISDTQATLNRSYIADFTSLNAGVPLSEINTRSIDYITKQFTGFMPIFICVFALSLMSFLCVNAILIKRNLRNFAIFSITGMPWKRCILFALSNSAMIYIGAIAIVSVCGVIVKALELTNTFAFDLGIWQLVTCVIIIVINTLISMLTPILILRSNTPKELLTNE